MALPITSSPLPPDVASSGWSAITVRVAWTLMRHGVRVKRESLRDARDHVLYHLDSATPLERAEDLATHLTTQFVWRARRAAPPPSWPQDVDMPLSPRWRQAIVSALTPLSDAVFRQHYGDGESLELLARRLQVDSTALATARGGLREVLRSVAIEDGLPIEAWPHERLDRLLARLASFACGPCPPLHEVAEGCHGEHTRCCPRCDRTSRLARGGVLTGEDLIPPMLSARPTGRVRVMALHFLPEGKHHRAAIAREAGVRWVPLGEDAMLLDAVPSEVVAQTLVLATEVGAPHRDTVRGIVVEGRGRWSSHGLLGPLADKALLRVRSAAWGEVETIGELPLPLPEPPSARRWWATTAVLALGLVASTAFALQPGLRDTDLPLQAEFSHGRGGVWTWFDTDEVANITLVRQVDGQLQLVFATATPADKARLALGDGSYRIHTMGEAALIASAKAPIDDIETMLDRANQSQEPLAELARVIRREVPGADVRFQTP